ncbi:MAG: 3-oxoacyl-ACP synthase III [Proteobacteria bacterium]|nr:3-oxoacyl-ACP synthase III [Pseudomonadota bacterium]
MTSGNATVEAIQYELAPCVVTSKEIEEEINETMARLRLPMGLLGMLTGIRERRLWSAGEMPSDVATRAARKVIDSYGIDPEDIGCIINTSVCRDYIEPSVACLVHGNLKLSSRCLNFDISNACLGFINAMRTMMLMIDAGQIKYGLIVDGEGSREILEATIKRLRKPDTTMDIYRENFATLTLGSGAVAMIIGHKDHSRTNHTINGIANLADTRYNRLCVGQRDFMTADASEIMNQGVKLAQKTWALAETILPKWRDDMIDVYIPHQVSAKNIQLLNKTLGITPEKHYLNFMTQGNMGPAAVPVTLKMAEEEGRIKSGDHVALMGIGSGLNCSMVSITW